VFFFRMILSIYYYTIINSMIVIVIS